MLKSQSIIMCFSSLTINSNKAVIVTVNAVESENGINLNRFKKYIATPLYFLSWCLGLFPPSWR